MNREITKRVYNALSLVVVAMFLLSLMTRCANIGSPSGGPKDSLPPVIINMSPDNFMTNADVNLKRVVIEFDEFVQIKDQQKHFYTSPAMKYKPQLQIRGRGVVVTLRDTLEENTTYSLNFGSAIQDNNEGNPLHTMRYVFSTGSEIDSMIVSGYTEDSFKSDSVSRTFILFYPVDSLDRDAIFANGDSTIFNSTPTSIARAESNGIFLAQNLKPIPYRIYAYEDSNDNQQYDPGVDRVGFVSGEHNPLQMEEFSIWLDTLRKYVVAEPQLHFRMFIDETFKRQVLTNNSRPTQNKVLLSFGAPNPEIESIVFDSIAQERIIVEYLSANRDSMAIWIRTGAQDNTIPDTLRGRVVYNRHDSLNNLVSHSQDLRLLWRNVESREEEANRRKLERDKARAEADGKEWIAPDVPNPFKVSFSTSKDLNPLKSVDLKLDYPVERFDVGNVELLKITEKEAEYESERFKRVQESKDSLALAQYIPYLGKPISFTIERDTMNLLLWRLSSDEWGEFGDTFTLNIPENSIENIVSQRNDEITNTFSLLDPSQFATIRIAISANARVTSKYIVELMNENGTNVIERKVGVDAGEVTFHYVPAGNVTVRITQDLNNNGIWDSGNIIEQRQPERSQFIVSSSGERVISTRKNWEVALNVDPASLFKIESAKELAERLAEDERRRIAAMCSLDGCDDPSHNHNHHDHDHDHSGHGHIH